MLKSDFRSVDSVSGARRRSNETLQKWNRKVSKFHIIQRPKDSICQLEILGYIRKIIQFASTSIT